MRFASQEEMQNWTHIFNKAFEAELKHGDARSAVRHSLAAADAVLYEIRIRCGLEDKKLEAMFDDAPMPEAEDAPPTDHEVA